ncbi:lipid A ABC transporter, ATP-binding/permease protein [Pseudomonas sp. CFII64]|nr:lipid A ABC transporter, ATP-binding/permease protein [Pseudomonas sp. CFII64]
MYARRWAQVWLSAGLLWFLLAIAFAPSNKIYQQGLVALVWVPGLALAWSARARLGEFWRQQRVLCVSLLLLGLWSTISLYWSHAEEPGREFKRMLYIGLFVLFFPILADARPDRVIRLMQWAGIGMALAALVSMIEFFGIRHNLWHARLEGIGELSHPILGAYVVGLAAIWMLMWPPKRLPLRGLWLLALVLTGGFVVLSQSRGAVLALFFTVVAMPIWCRNRRAYLVAGTAVLLAAIGFWLLEPLMMARGSSYRPEIFVAAIKMIGQHPWIGIGLGAPYDVVVADGLRFDHSHNLFTHTAIQLGVPGMLLWAVVWLAVLREAWRGRDTPLGRGLLGMWLFSTLAMQFDAASLTGSPRAEWFISWLPIGLATVMVWARAQRDACDKIARSSTSASFKMSDKASDAGQSSSLKIYFRLLNYVRPYIGIFLLSIIGFVIFASTQPMLAGILKYFVDGLSNPEAVLFPNVPYLRDLQLLQAVPLLIVLIAAWQGLGSYLGNYFLAKVSLGLVHDLRVELFNKLLVLPNRYFDTHNSGHLISRITFNVTMVTGAATDAIKVVIREGLTIVFLFIYLLWMNWQLTLVMLAILPLIATMVGSASKKFRKQSKKIQVAMGDVTHVASETIQGYRVVRSFGGEKYEQDRFAGASQSNTDKQLRMTKTGAVYTPMLQLVIYTAMAVLMFLVLYLRGDATAGDLVAYITAAGLLPKPIRQLSEVSSTIQKGVAGAESIFEQLDVEPEFDTGTVERERVTGHLEVKNLSFTYPGTERQVLNDISFAAAPGQMIALVGRSGSGKSTLANLIPRFYQHNTGQILLDGVEISDYTLRNLRRHIAQVTQSVTLFNDSVANNIAYGDLAGAPRADIEAAAADAYAKEFIDQLPEGFDTQVGENGVLLSGGQRQRLAIARALLKNAPLLILDEATSALDTESERHIQAALDQVMKGRTTLVIAHRLTTIERADLILVMDAGRIVERGTHAELLAQNGYYARLHAMGLDEPAPVGAI